MKTFYWNIRGVGNLDLQNAFRVFCLQHKLDIVFISKPMIPLDDVPFNFLSSCNLRLVSENKRGELLGIFLLCCDINLNVDVILNMEQQISLDLVLNNRTTISGVYESTNYI